MRFHAASNQAGSSMGTCGRPTERPEAPWMRCTYGEGWYEKGYRGTIRIYFPRSCRAVYMERGLDTAKAVKYDTSKEGGQRGGREHIWLAGAMNGGAWCPECRSQYNHVPVHGVDIWRVFLHSRGSTLDRYGVRGARNPEPPYGAFCLFFFPPSVRLELRGPLGPLGPSSLGSPLSMRHLKEVGWAR